MISFFGLGETAFLGRNIFITQRTAITTPEIKPASKKRLEMLKLLGRTSMPPARIANQHPLGPNGSNKLLDREIIQLFRIIPDFQSPIESNPFGFRIRFFWFETG